MKHVGIMGAAIALAIILGGCANGTQPQASNESTGADPSARVSSEGPDGEASSQSAGESASSSASSSGAKGPGEFQRRVDPNYVLPDSDRVVYSTAELEELDDDELYYARNELYARHGAKFEDEDLRKHFNVEGWYRAIEPKLDEYGSEVLNLVEGTNAATLRRIELDRGSARVNALDSKRVAMYEAYLAKAEEYQRQYGATELVDRDEHQGLTGLCLAQLVDFDGDGWEELLVAYHDGLTAPEGGFFDPGTYQVEVWSYRDGEMVRTEQRGAESTQATSAYFMLYRTEGGYELGSSWSPDGGLLYYFRLSQSDFPAAGDSYWFSSSDVTFDFDQMQTITEETLATLGAKGATVGRNSELKDGNAR